MENISDFFEILLDSEKLIAYGGLTLLLLIIFAETGLFFGFIFPGDALLITAGLLCSTDSFDVNIYLLLTSVSLVAILGNMTGYATGKYFGKKLFAKEDSLFFKKKHLDITRSYFQKYGGAALIMGRFLPIVRTFAPIMAGASEISFLKFTFYNVLGGVIWVWSLIPIGFLLGRKFPLLVNEVEYIFLFVAIATSIIFLIGYFKQKRSMKAGEDPQLKNPPIKSTRKEKQKLNLLKNMSKQKSNKLLWNSLGFLSVALGIIGYIIPLMPGIVFFLIAIYCFSRGSKKFLFRLARHKHVGQPIRDFSKKRGITIRHKGILTISVIPAILFSAFVVANALWLKITICACAILALLIIWGYKTKEHTDKVKTN